MRKVILIGILVLCMVSPALALDRKVVESAHTSANTTSLAVATTSTIYTRSFPLFSASTDEDIGVAYYMTPATGDTAIYFEQSAERPTTEGSSDIKYMQTHVIDSSVTGTQWELATIDTVNLMYGRFKIVGQNSNPATTVLSIKYVK